MSAKQFIGILTLVTSIFLNFTGCGSHGSGTSDDNGNNGETKTNYRVTYDSNGVTIGSVPIDTRLYKEGDLVTVIGNTGNLVKSGYTFEGWIKTLANGTFNNFQEGQTFILGTNDVTLKAQWNKITNSGKWVNGYYVTYQDSSLTPEEIYWKGLTHITVGAILANENGTLDTEFFGRGTDLAKKLSTLAKQNNVKPVLMLGGAGNGTQIKEALSSHFDAFIDNLIKTTTDLGYQGIDLDWENDIDWPLFVSLVKTLSEKAPNFILTVPTGVINPNIYSDLQQPVNFKQLEPYIDQFNMMSYGSWITIGLGPGWYSGHTSPLKTSNNNPISIEDSLKRYANAGIPKSKLGMGIGFFGVSYTGDITAPGQNTDGHDFKGGDNSYPLSSLFISKGYLYAQANRCIKWDAVSECSYLSLPEIQKDNFGCQYVTFDDEKSIIAKGKFCRDNDYGGTIIWTINQGNVKGHYSNPNFIMQALQKGFLEPNCVQKDSISIIPQKAYVKPGKSFQFRSLINGTDNTIATWGTSKGTVNNGYYTAPSETGTYTISATTINEKTILAQVIVSNDDWKPIIVLFNTAEYWMEINTESKDKIKTITLERNGALTQVNQGYSSTNFNLSTQVLAGDKIRFYIESSDGKSAKTEEIPFIHSTTVKTVCPIE